jgi:hypothetical protein
MVFKEKVKKKDKGFLEKILARLSNSKGTPFWEILFVERRLPQKLKNLFSFENWKKWYLIHYGWDYLGRNKDLEKLIKGQRILLIGSGPSAKDLKKIPKDVKIFTCNASAKILSEKKINREIDLFVAFNWVLNNYSNTSMNVFNSISKIKINYFISDKVAWTKQLLNKNKIKTVIIKDFWENNYYFRNLIYHSKYSISIKQILKNDFGELCNSTGIRLLQYSLYFDAKEIYLIGIDAVGANIWDEKKSIHKHQIIDNNFLKIVSKKYSNVYSASKNSPITKYLKYKKLK